LAALIGRLAPAQAGVGDEAVIIGSLALVVLDFDGEPIDAQRVFGVAHRHGGKPAVDRCRALATSDDSGAVFFEFGADEIFGDGGMRSRLAGEDEVPADLLGGGGDGLTGEQIIAEKDRPVGIYRPAVP
jgi:hypothetical protein